nr:MAG TPA: Lower collar protein [Caudoviricetes sp.]
MFLAYPYETKTLTNTIEQLVISDHVLSPLENQTLDTMIEAAVPLIFNFDFPFYVDASAPEYATAKLAFEKTFCLQYFREQIGLETIGEFQYHLKRILTVNNPYYEQLYRSITFEYNPIITHNSTRKVTSTKDDTRTGVISGDSTAKNTTTADTNNNTQNIHSDNPQINFAGTNYASTMERGQNTIHNSAVSNGENTTKTNSTDTYHANNNDTIEDAGFDGSYSLEIQRFRDTILNLNKRICDDCRELFYQFY